MGDLIQFPIPEGERRLEANAPISIHGLITPENCAGTMHVFAEVPGPCCCGAEFWGQHGLEEPSRDAIGIHYVA